MDDEHWTDDPVPIPPRQELERDRQRIDPAHLGWWLLLCGCIGAIVAIATWVAVTWWRS